jgi:hypothetical protein
MQKLILQIWWILLRLGFYFPDCGNLRSGWGDRWHIAAVTAPYAQGLCLYGTAGGFHYNSASSPLVYCAAICQVSPNRCRNCQHSPIDLKPGHSKIHQIWRTSFYINGCTTVQTVALRPAIFKRKKWVCARLNLALS